MTNRGLRIELPVIRRDVDEYIAVLDCPSSPRYEDTSFLAIFLKQLSTVDEQYARVNVNRLAEVHEQGSMQTIYVRQNIAIPDLGGIFRNHILRLRDMPGNWYRIVKVLAPVEARRPTGLTSCAGTSEHEFPRTFRIKKVSNHFLCSIIVFERMGGPALVVMLGSEEGFAIGFNAIDAHDPDRFTIDDLNAISQFLSRKSPEAELHWNITLFTWTLNPGFRIAPSTT